MNPGQLPSVIGPSEAAAAPRAIAPAVGDVRGRRRAGALVAVLAGGLLAIAAMLDPSPAGLGTHEQLNLPSCGWIVLMDLPCPTCGMTTAFAHAADGNLLRSLATQPLGGLLAIGTAMAFVLGLYTAITGSRIGGLIARTCGRRAGWWLVALVLVAWAYKVVSYRLGEGWLS
jgi:hypothetical protein